MAGRVLALSLTFAVFTAPPAVAADEPKPADLVLVQKGTLPIIVSAPHGGSMKVPGVPERSGKGVANFYAVSDSNTLELTEVFAAELEKQLGGKPWLVVARFDRKYIDANRPPEGAYETDKAKPYYDAYHDALTAACKAVKKEFGRGILLDVHGQGEFDDAICRGTQNGKTVTLLKERFFWPAVSGKRSVLGQMQRGGYKVRPDCDAPEKTKEDAKFSGGYTVGTYGSHTGYGIDAIQLEFGTDLRDTNRYRQTAKDLADAVAVFYEEYLKDAKK
jgi:N-formylglutamate amidohydrolase